VHCNRTAPGRKSLNSFLPFSVPESAILISVALGAIAGLFLFFHGFSLLQNRQHAPARNPSKTTAQTTTITTTTTFTTKGGDTLKRDSKAEVIQLSPADDQQNGSVSMSQQGKIAAALLKAGIPNPATWSDPRAQTGVRVADAPNDKHVAPSAPNAELSRVLQQGAAASAFRLPALAQNASRNSSDWKATLMVWGGPILTLACIYVLVAHLGWL
jgi:hypothetical protein